MSQSNNSGNNWGGGGGGGGGGGTAKVGWGTKVGYIGTGVLIGLIIYPFVRRALSKIQPKVDDLFDNLTGKAENLAEKASDILSKAKENLYNSDREKHPHSHATDKTGSATTQ